MKYIARRRPDAEFPILTGVSAGAINATFLAGHQGSLEVGVDGLAEHWAKGGAGASELAEAVVHDVDADGRHLRYVYEDEDPLWTKIDKIAQKIYGASEIIADTSVRRKLDQYQNSGFGDFPICIAKTQYSFSTDPRLRGAPSNH
ncbi:MAG: formate--tetrahydrofolate ligase, partial [Gemmatimonadota bacterium]